MRPTESPIPPSTPSAFTGVPVVGRALASVERRLSTPDAQRLPDALADLFLTQVIDARTEDIAGLAEQKAADVRLLIYAPFLARLTEEIASRARSADQDLARNGRGNRTSIESRLAQLYLPHPTIADFASTRAFAALLARSRLDLTWRGGIKPSPFADDETQAVATILLCALQTIAFEVVEVHYTTPSRPQDVPFTVQQAVSKLLEAIDATARALNVGEPLISFALVQARSEWSLARAEGRVWLPLRAIPTAPLADANLAKHYVGRPDEGARRLGFQLRRADGAVLVSGYRGVGKSSFVNRVLYHAVLDQTTGESSGTTIVPVTINLAKASGVSNVLRLTLRGLRAALLNDEGEPMLLLEPRLHRQEGCSTRRSRSRSSPMW
ncbi:MAG TPA: hypothetical protein VGM82_08340 [Gemmatimonadaceae bacterium]|jgi:hypothetical protein